MAITVVGETTHGTFEEIMEQLRQLNDEYEVLSINVIYGRTRKPLLSLVKRCEDYADSRVPPS
jgi:hypothetical protein